MNNQKNKSTCHISQTDNISQLIFSKRILGICFAVLLLGFIAVTVLKIPLGSLLLTAMFIACPLVHIFMMKDHILKK